MDTKTRIAEILCRHGKLSDGMTTDLHTLFLTMAKEMCVVDKRENTIQKLLRHAFSCIQKLDCTCAKNIQSFLLNDDISIKWSAAIATGDVVKVKE